MSSKSVLPDDAQPGDAVLAYCPACNELVHVLVLPGNPEYLPQVTRQLERALAEHVTQTGHDKTARAAGRKESKEHGDHVQ